MGKFRRRTLLVGAGAAVGAYCTSKVLSGPVPTGTVFPPAAGVTGETVLNDASLLNPTRIARHITITGDDQTGFVETLRGELASAKSEGRKFSASAARHSMGGQSLPADGVAMTLDQNWLEPDTAAGTYRVSPGMRWHTIVKRLDAIGFSPKVMQSNNDFGVASTFSVNAHGWPVPWSAFGSTVKSIDLMLHDGQIVKCSRFENADLFGLTMGGYGLTGIITELEVEMVPNKRLVPSFEELSGRDFGKRFLELLRSDTSLDMAYGRLDVSIDSFFEEALIISYRPDEDQSDIPAVSDPGFVTKFGSRLFRSQLNSERVKDLRWLIETKMGPHLAGGVVTRNDLINEPFATLAEDIPTRTDILHEYFVSPDRFHEFIDICRDVIPSSYQQLLNITLRFVDTDKDSVLNYATEPRIAAVMLFSQEMSVRGEADMQRMTANLIEGVISIGGSYYLPYRLHASDRQIQSAYKRLPEFVQRKREIDPSLVFGNALWDRYMSKL